jgi:hypothetical protein
MSARHSLRGLRAGIGSALLGALLIGSAPSEVEGVGGSALAIDEPCVDVLKNAGASNPEAVAFCAAAFGNTDAALAAYELAQDAIDLANDLAEAGNETADAAIEAKNEAMGEVLRMMIDYQQTSERIVAGAPESDQAVGPTPTGPSSSRGEVPEILLAVLIEIQEESERDLAEPTEEIASVNKRKQAIREVKQMLEQAEQEYYTQQIAGLLSAIVIVGTRDGSIATEPSLHIRMTPTPTPSESVTTRSGITITLPETGGNGEPRPPGQSVDGNPTTRSGIILEIDDGAGPGPTATATPTRTPTPARTMPPRDPVTPLR